MLLLGKTLYGKTADVSFIEISTNGTLPVLGKTLYSDIADISFIVDWVLAIRQCGHWIDSSSLAGLDKRRILAMLDAGDNSIRKIAVQYSIYNSCSPLRILRIARMHCR